MPQEYSNDFDIGYDILSFVLASFTQPKILKISNFDFKNVVGTDYCKKISDLIDEIFGAKWRSPDA